MTHALSSIVRSVSRTLDTVDLFIRLIHPSNSATIYRLRGALRFLPIRWRHPRGEIREASTVCTAAEDSRTPVSRGSSWGSPYGCGQEKSGPIHFLPILAYSDGCNTTPDRDRIGSLLWVQHYASKHGQRMSRERHMRLTLYFDSHEMSLEGSRPSSTSAHTLMTSTAVWSSLSRIRPTAKFRTRTPL